MARTGTIVHVFNDDDNWLGMGCCYHTFNLQYRYYPGTQAITDWYNGSTPGSDSDIDITSVELVNNTEVNTMEKKYIEDSFMKYLQEFDGEYYSVLEQVIIQENEKCYD